MEDLEARQRWGGEIRRRRRARGLTLAQLAARIGCVKGYLSAIENGRRPPPAEPLARRLEAELGVEAGSIVRAGLWCRLSEGQRAELVVQGSRPDPLGALRGVAGLESAIEIRAAIDMGAAPAVLAGDWVILGPAEPMGSIGVGRLAATQHGESGARVQRVGLSCRGAGGALHRVLGVIRVLGGRENAGTGSVRGP